MKAPVSACLIVKNEIHTIERCLQSLRPYVEEIVVVDTGSTDGTPDVVKKFADKFAIFTDCNDPATGLIEDFSMARQRSFDLATQPWLFWVDGDDEVQGAEKLLSITQRYDKTRGTTPIYIMMPYEYSRDAQGNVNCLHYRERLVTPRHAFRWKSPVHEVLESTNAIQDSSDEIVIVHKRDFSKKTPETGRNLRILKKYYEKVGETDIRQLYYLGLEYGNVGDIGNAIKFHKRYIELSGWDDERFLAALKIAEHYQSIGDYEPAIDWALKAMTIREGWAEAYFSLAKSYYFLAQRGGPESRRCWEKCVHFGNLGLSLPPTKTILFVNPIEREYEIHRYLNLALSNTGRVSQALESVTKGLKIHPTDESFLINKKIFESHVAKEEIDRHVVVLSSHGEISSDSASMISDVIHGRSKPAPVVPALEIFHTGHPIDLKLPKESRDQREHFKVAYESLPIPVKDEPPVSITETSNPFFLPDIALDTPPANLPGHALLSMAKHLWKHLLLHDEVLSAQNFLLSLPWHIREHEDVKLMKSITGLMLTHINLGEPSLIDPYVFKKEAIPLPDQIRFVHGQFARFEYLLGKLKDIQSRRSGPVTVLDIGCIDGWVTNRLGLFGYRAWGIDHVPVDLANAKAAEFRTGARHAQVQPGQELPADFPKLFDVVVLFEVYEHVADTVALLKQAYQHVAPGGVLIVSTPRGSWCQGVPVEFHYPWNDVRPREHIRAPLLSEVLEDLKKAGFENPEGAEFLIDQSEQPTKIHGQASICAMAYRPGLITVAPPPPVQSFKRHSLEDVVIYVGHGPECWNPVTATKTGIGGSETAVIEMSRRLAAKGHRVRVYGDCIPRDGNGPVTPRSLEGVFDGVEYLDVSKYKNLECDILITSRRPAACDDEYNIRRKASFCWVHDVHLGSELNHGRALRIDKFLTLSDWHRKNVLGMYPFVHPSQVIQTRNGINNSRFNKKIPRNPHRAVYSSSPDRGMEVAITIWPRVRERVPGAELHIFYGFQTWEACADDAQRLLINRLKRMIHDYETAGVVFHGRVSQDQLAEEYLKSGVWAYPTWFVETSCISAMEAHAAGLRMVTSPIAALNETVGPRGVMVPGDWLSLPYQNQFIDAIVGAMTAPDNSDREAVQNYAKNNFDWDGVASDWSRMFKEVISEVELNVMPPYKGIQ